MTPAVLDSLETKSPALLSLHNELKAMTTESQTLLGKPEPSIEDFAKAKELTDTINAHKLKIKSLADLTAETKAALMDLNGSPDASIKSVLNAPQHGTDYVELSEEKPGMKMYRLIEQSGDDKLTPTMWKKTFDASYNNGIRSLVKARGDRNSMTPEALKAISEGFDGEGGYLVPADIAMRLIERKPTPTRINSFVDTINTARDMVIVPRANYDPSDLASEDIYTSPMRFKWTGEKPLTSTEHRMTEPSWGNLEIPIYTAMGSILLTNNMIEDSIFDINAWLTRKIMETLDILYDSVILSGTGVGQPEGVLRAPGTAGNPAVVNIGSPMNPDGLVKLAYSLPEQYDENARFVFKKTTTGRDIALMKDLDNRYLFGAGVMDSGISYNRPTTLVGYPFAYSHLMPDSSLKDGTNQPNNYPVAFGDWSGYLKAQRLAISMKVLDQVYAELNMVAIVIRIRFGGKIAEPWKLLAGKVAA